MRSCLYSIDLVYAVQVENTSESDPHSYEATKGWGFNRMRTQQGFIAQLEEHHTCIMEVMGSNPIETSESFNFNFYGAMLY